MSIQPVLKLAMPFDYTDDSARLLSGSKCSVTDMDGKTYLDLCSGLWNIPFGFRNPHIMHAVQQQMAQLEYCNLLGHVGELQYHYAKRLLGYAGDYSCLLFTCSGSETLDAAIKTARKYQILRGYTERNVVGSFSLAYHGTTYGAMTISGLDAPSHLTYGPMLPHIALLAVPAALSDEKAWIEAIDNFLDAKAGRLAGFIVEPVMASAGVWPVPLPALRHLVKRCRDEDILLIMDEVATGFGRCGVPFLSQLGGLEPDLLCLSKAINNGCLPMGALLFSSQLAEILASAHTGLEHFSTQGGNLLAVAAANATLDLMMAYESYAVSSKGEAVLSVLRQGLSDLPQIELRQIGLMLAIDFKSMLSLTQVLEIYEQLKKHGLLLYLFNALDEHKGLSLFPAYIFNQEDLVAATQKLIDRLRRILSRMPLRR